MLKEGIMDNFVESLVPPLQDRILWNHTTIPFLPGVHQSPTDPETVVPEVSDHPIHSTGGEAHLVYQCFWNLTTPLRASFSSFDKKMNLMGLLWGFLAENIA